MRFRFVILSMLLAAFEIAVAAPPKKSNKVYAGGDSTSYIYYHSLPTVDLFYWEKTVRIAPPPPPHVTVSPLVDTLCAQLNQNSPLFSLPENRPRVQHNLVTFEINETEYLVGIPSDNTSYMYQRRDRNNYTHADSLVMYTPFDLTKLGNFTLPFYGIDAWQIEIENKSPERFHIDIGSKKSSIEFPSEMLIPMVLSLILILIANFYSRGYIHRLLMINCFYNAFNNAASERNISAEKAGWTLFANYILNVSLFALIIMSKYGLTQPFYCLLALLIGCGSVIVIFIIKLLVSMFFSNLFLCRDTFTLHYTNLSYILQMLGVVLLPINFCMVYIGYEFTVETLFVIGVVACILAELIKLIRLIKIIFDKHFSIFYLFLYLCGVELLPVLLAIKLLSR